MGLRLKALSAFRGDQFPPINSLQLIPVWIFPLDLFGSFPLIYGHLICDQPAGRLEDMNEDMAEDMNEDMAEERNEETHKGTDETDHTETDEEVALFLSPWYNAVKTFHRLFDAAQDDTITPDRIFAEYGRDPHRAGNAHWLYYRMREFRHYGLVEATYQPINDPRGGGKRLKDFRLTPKGKQALQRYGVELKDGVEPPVAAKRWVPPQKEALTFDSALLFLIEWQRENPSFGLTIEISVEGAVALDVRLKGKEQK